MLLIRLLCSVFLGVAIVGCGSKKITPSPITVAHGVVGGVKYGVKVLKAQPDAMSHTKLTSTRKPSKKPQRKVLWQKKPKLIKKQQAQPPEFIITKNKQTVIDISRKYNISAKEIAAINGLNPEEKLMNGRKIFLR